MIGDLERSKLEMNYLRQVTDWVRSRADAIWKAMAPHAGPGVAGGAVVDLVRRRRELVIENAMLRHQIVILRRTSPHPRLMAFDRLLLAANRGQVDAVRVGARRGQRWSTFIRHHLQAA